MQWYIMLPGIVFFLLCLGELFLPTVASPSSYHRWDWVLNMTGFLMQGLIVPLFGWIIATQLLPSVWGSAKGCLPLSAWEAFLLNFIGIDFIYYWQHRSFHQIDWLWQLHRCHHASPRVDIFATARNSIFINFIFVYMLINPILGFLCKNPAGFFAAVTLTASLDLLRHTRIHLASSHDSRFIIKVLSFVFVTPSHHHRHHVARVKPANFGANFIIWDRIFKTICTKKMHNVVYQDPTAPHPLRQLLHPLKD